MKIYQSPHPSPSTEKQGKDLNNKLFTSLPFFQGEGLGWGILILLLLSLPARSQTPVQVVTRVIEKELPYIDGQRVRLTAQKADITLKGWNRPTISVKLRLVAKHPDKATAEREVGYHQYVLQAEKGLIDLSNRFVIPQRGGKLQSQLKAIYEISLPNKALLTLSNSFGDIHLSDLAGDVNLTFEFGKLAFEDVSGKVSISSSYGDIDGRNMTAVLTLKAEKADVTLRDLGGTANLQSRYGKLSILPASSLDALTVDAARTEILVSVNRLSDFRFDVMSTFSDIRVPQEVSDQVSKYGGKQVFGYQPTGRKPEIKIQNSYSPITIQDGKSVVNR